MSSSGVTVKRLTFCPCDHYVNHSACPLKWNMSKVSAPWLLFTSNSHLKCMTVLNISYSTKVTTARQTLLSDLVFISVSSRCQAVQEEAAIRAICSAQPHRMHHVVCHSDYHPHKVNVTITTEVHLPQTGTSRICIWNLFTLFRVTWS